MAQHNDASVEDILDSIKKVIARDSREALTAQRQRSAAPTRRGDEEEAELASDNADAKDAQDEVLDLAEMELSDNNNDFDSDEDDGNDADAPLVREDARGAMQENLAALAMLAEPGAKPQIVRSGETSLEGLTRELLRPMLAQWLDENLPGMVERMVQAEIARIAGKRG